ncbi:(Na+)-NQR maturation NqrM [Ferrimonas balearica]|uniref:(Na+)-NQR maturation NqrM n=1 Tax=Ferrimonas balearica TaxID=44012 RepID=UPI001C99F541|nr:(Na+)-NQR maturation NqrM [Ferrimonas balearica]MBY5921423.1 (Na+)-NQR maturation NqrM [Ferrimonas balearica]MBY5995892.1 (Na+)-NQR maturation NqrM [Ferrimonas balearica]
MNTFFATFAAMLLLFGLMSVGYLIKRKAISGSCGGLAGVGIEKECDCPEPCDKRKAKMAKEAAEAERRERLAQNRII